MAAVKNRVVGVENRQLGDKVGVRWLGVKKGS